MEKLKYSMLNQLVNETIDKYQRKLVVFELIVPILKTFEGKTISKRIQTKVKELMPEYTVYYGSGYTYITLSIWGNGIAYDDKVSFDLCQVDAKDKTFKLESVIRYPQWYDYQSAIDRLNDFKFNSLNYISKWNKFLDQLKEIKEEFKDIPYPVSKYFDLRELHRYI